MSLSRRNVLPLPLLALMLILGLAFLCPAPVHADVGFQPVSADELKMTGDPNAPGAAAIILYRQVDRYDDNETRIHEDDYVRIKIFTTEGLKYATVEVPLELNLYNITNVHARTIHPDGQTIEFDGKLLDKDVVKTKGFGFLAKTFTLPDVQPGSILEYYYTVDYAEHLIFDSNWVLSQELFTKLAKFTLRPYSAPGWRLTWSHNLRVGTPPPHEDPDHVVRTEAHDIPALEFEDLMPPLQALQERVDFIYSDHAVETDATKFWREEGKHLNSEMESFVGKRGLVIPGIYAPEDSPQVKAQKIYARVQQLRNTSFEITKTQQEAKRAKEKEKAAGSAEETWKRGYGDHRSLNWLFLSLARGAGIESSGAWVSTRDSYIFNPKLMQSSHLNRTVAILKLDGQDVYFDPGTAFMPFGLLPWPETGVQALRMNKDGGAFVTTPMPSSAVSRTDRVAKMKLLDTGDISGTVQVTYAGLEAAERRITENQSDDVTRKKFLEDEFQEFVPSGIDVHLTNQPDWKSSEPTLVAEFSLKVSGWTAAAGRRALLPVGLFSAPEKHSFEHANRVHPIYFDHPVSLLDDITIDLPAGWQVSSLPPPMVQDAKVLIYSLKVEDNKTSVHIVRKFSNDIPYLVDAKFYPTIRSIYQSVRKSDESQIVLLPGAATASK